MIPTSSPFSLQPSGRRYMFLLSNFKPKESGPDSCYLPQRLKTKSGEKREKHPWKTANSASQPVIHQKEEKESEAAKIQH